MSSPTNAPGVTRLGSPDSITNYLQHSIGLCNLFLSLESSGDPDILGAAGRPAVLKTGRLRGRRIADGELDVRRLNRVLALAPTRAQADVQAWCTMRTLVDATTSIGMLPAVVTPYAAQTVGDAIGHSAGGGRSFAAGTFGDTVREAEVIGLDAITRIATKDGPDADLLRSVRHAGGSAGLVTRATIALVAAEPYVVVRHERFDSLAGWWDAAQAAAASGRHRGERFDFLEGALAGGAAFLSCASFVAAGRIRQVAASLGVAAPAAPGTGANGYLSALGAARPAICRTRDYPFRLAPGRIASGRWVAPQPRLREVTSPAELAHANAIEGERPGGPGALPLIPCRTGSTFTCIASA